MRRRALERLELIDELRAAAYLISQGLTVRELADMLSISDAQAHRLLQAAERRRGQLQPNPEEIILRAFAYGTDRRELIETLKTFPYTFGEDAPAPHEGRLPGTWDQVVSAHGQGLLSRDEFGEISAAIDR